MRANNLKREASVNSIPTTIIRPLRGWRAVNLRELWAYRELLYFLTWRDIKIRYKQTILGFAWAILQPFLMMVVFSLFFGNLLKVPSEGIPYPLFNYAAMLPWTLFAQGITRSSESLVGNVSMVQKIYFPRLLMPSTPQAKQTLRVVPARGDMATTNQRRALQPLPAFSS